MQFDHHNMTGAHLAESLANHPQQWDPVELAQLLESHWIEPGPLTTEHCAGLETLGRRLHEVFAAASHEQRCTTVNALLAGRSTALLAMHDGLPPHLHFAADDEDLLNRVRAFTAGSLALFLVQSAGRRLGCCRRGGCRVVYLDTSRHGRQRYCSPRCSNYDAVARHRRAR